MAGTSTKKRKQAQDATAVHAVNQLTDAEALLNEGSLSEGQALLESIVKKNADAQVVAVAKYTLAMLYLCQDKSHAADKLLESLGLRYRLNDSAFSTKTRSVENPSSISNHVQVQDNAFDAGIVSYFQEKLNHESSPFWSDHRYGEPDVGYFSYAFRDCNSAAPRNGIEKWIQSELLPAVKKAFPEKAKSIAHAEWWAHSRDQISGHQLHYDTDETRLTQDHTLNYPIVSTVWYITPGSSGAPTLVTDKLFGQDANKSNGYLVYPEKNRLTMFDGRLLHGVVPHLIPKSTEKSERLTLMVGFWDKDVASSDYNSAQPTANMVLTEDTSKIAWSQHLSEAWKLDQTNQAVSSPPVAIHQVNSPLWVELPQSLESLEGNVLVGKYFVEELSMLDSDIAGMLAEPNEVDREWLIENKDAPADVLSPRLFQTLFVLFEWMKRGDEYLETAGDYLLELTAHCPAAGYHIRSTSAWASLVMELIESSEHQETLAAIAWNVLKLPTNDALNFFFSPEMVEALMNASEMNEDCVGMVCGALAYCLDFVPNRKWLVEQLGSSLYDLYDERENDQEFQGHQDILDTEHAIQSVIKINDNETKKLLSVLKKQLKKYFTLAKTSLLS